MKQKLIISLLVFFCFFNQHGFTIDRVILASDSNPLYLDFWPIVANAWTKLTSIRPTLALIADEDVVVDETVGGVIRFKPLKNISTGFQAQVIRLLLPAYFEDDVCLISDIDMIPLSKEYFTDSVKDIARDAFVIYRNAAYEQAGMFDKYPMCYNAALGKTFKHVFNIKSIHDIPTIIEQWHALGHGWNTDELMLYAALENWEENYRCVKLNHLIEKRIDRACWYYDEDYVRRLYYIDSHLLRPYQHYKAEVDALIHALNI